MKRVPGIAWVVAVTLAGVAGCGTHAARHPVPTGDQTDASGRHFLLHCGLTSGRVDDGSFMPVPLQPAPYVPYSDSVFAW